MVSPSPLSLRTLGSLRLIGSDGEELLRGRRKELALLAYLARRAPASVPRALLATLLWGDRGEERARNSLRQALFQLKRAVGEPLLVTADQVQLPSEIVALDLAAFESDFAAGRLAEGVARWEGDFLAGMEDAGADGFVAWIVQERAGAERRLVAALQRLIQDALSRGALVESVGWAERWLALRPHDERAAIRVVELLRLAGREEEASARHAAFEALLRLELEQEPSPAFLALADRRDAAATRVVSETVPNPGAAALFTPDLIGRDEYLQALSTAWRQVRAGEGAARLVEGEMGIGRTRLIQAFRRTVELEGSAVVMHARGSGAEAEPAWSTVRELLAPLRDAPALGGAPPELLSRLLALLPSLADRFPRLSPISGDDQSLAGAVRRAIEIVAEDGAVALLVDDLHRADPSSRAFITSLAHRPPSGALVVMTVDSGDLATAPDVAALRESRSLTTVRPRPLQVDEVGAMLASMIELSPGDRHPLAMRLHAETGGNPFWTAELMAALVDSGRLVHDGRGVWHLSSALDEGPLPLPASAREILGWRVARLSVSARAVLAVAARSHPPATPAALEEGSELARADFDAAIDELLARRMLRPTADGAGFEVAHGMLRRAAAERLPLSRRRRVRSQRRFLVAALILFVSLGIAAATRRAWSSDEAQAVAVGAIRVAGAPDSVSLAATVRELLVTDLAQLPGTRLIATSPLDADRGVSRETLAAAARSAGADRLVEGTLSRTEEGWRLDLRVLELRSGAISGARTVQGSDLFALVDDATSALARTLGLRDDGARIADVTTRSLTAYRLYEEGLHAYRAADSRTAFRLFSAALREDSAFAMAAYYASRSAGELGDAWALHERAVRLASRATDRERLLILGTWAASMDEPRRLAIAETLAVRYPGDPAGHLLLGQARLWGGDFLGAVPHLRRVVALETAGDAGARARCLSCDAYDALATAYGYADSLAASERTAREWIRARPTSPDARVALAYATEHQGRFDDALAALRAADSLANGALDVTGHRVGIWMRQGDFASGDRLWGERLAHGDRAAREGALWGLAISYRTQGRLREAHEVARRYRSLDDGRLAAALPEALVLLERGRAGEAAAIFDSTARVPFSGRSRARDARARVWNLVHLATARVAAGDTAGLARIADTIQVLGRESAYARDGRAHHQVRGLLLAAAGRWDSAAVEFRQALFSPWGGYVRTNVELGRALMQAGRAREAIPILDAALRGPIGASGLYATRSELQVLLGRAYEGAGQVDNAIAMYERAIAAWAQADEPIRTERDRLRAHVAELRR